MESSGNFPVTGSASRAVKGWVKFDATSSQTICGWGDDTVTAGNRYEFRVDSANGQVLRVECNGGSIRATTDVCDGNWHHVAVVLNGTNLNQHVFYVDGALDSVAAASSRTLSTQSNQPLRIGAGYTAANGGSVHRFLDGNIESLAILDSNISNITADYISSEYANQNSPSTFGSSSGWTTGGGVSGISAFDIDKPTFSATGSATLPNPIGSVSFDVDKPLFSSSGSATLPQPVGAVSFDIAKPLLSSSGSATLPQPVGSLSFDIDKPIFSGAGSATLPNPAGSVSFDINAPTFAATGSATQTSNVGDVAFTVDSPIFSASGTATLPQPIGSVSFAIDSPVFSATGTVSGLVQNYADDAIVAIRYGKNTEIISYGKNIVIVTSGNNIVKL